MKPFNTESKKWKALIGLQTKKADILNIFHTFDKKNVKKKPFITSYKPIINKSTRKKVAKKWQKHLEAMNFCVLLHPQSAA
jgi:hypothetical protein